MVSVFCAMVSAVSAPAAAPAGPNTVTSSPMATPGTSVTSRTVWSMQTRPSTGAGQPRTSITPPASDPESRRGYPSA